jgi:hypothetical protein
MATVLEECTTEERRSVMRFLWAKGLITKDNHKEMFLAYGGKCLSLKAVHNCVEKFSQGRLKVVDDARPDAEVCQTTVKILVCCGFRRIGKAMGQVYECCWRICREINVFPRFEYHMFHVLYLFVTYLLSLARITNSSQISCTETTSNFEQPRCSLSWGELELNVGVKR